MRKGKTVEELLRKKGGGVGGLPKIWAQFTDKYIQEVANSATDEDTVLISHGFTQAQVIKIKRIKRWRHNWGIGKAQFKIDKNKIFAESKDPSVQKVISTHTLPRLEEIEDNYLFEIDAPEWFVKGIRGRKGTGKKGEITRVPENGTQATA